MKPTKRIQEILKSSFLTSHIKLVDTESAIVAAILQYLDEQWEESKNLSFSATTTYHEKPLLEPIFNQSQLEKYSKE